MGGDCTEKNRTDMAVLLEEIPPVDSHIYCRDVAELFRQKESTRGFAVVEAGEPVGIIARDELTIRLASQYGHAVYGRRAVTELMDNNPLIVELKDDVHDVEKRIAEGYPNALLSGFIIVENGFYRGMGTGLSLLKSSVERTRVRNAKLEAITEQAQQANTVKSQFLANMSHELRTPLNAVIGFSELIVQEVYGKIEQEKYKDYARDILDSGRHLLSMINDILDMSKIEAGRYELKEQPIDLDRALVNATKMCRVLADEKNIELSYSGVDGHPILKGDERAVKQMLLNLVSNGIKYTPPNGTVSVSADFSANGTVSIEVADSGVGIEEALLEKVLEPFAQAGADINNKTEGTGLGLPIVKALAELHAAEFLLVSNVGIGTTATLIFPAERISRIQNNPAA
ncbi:MAG: ATP-binding protein [Sneathiellales bacterium]|nr:ATP-binding protein [Sneathiellales bacterium]